MCGGTNVLWYRGRGRTRGRIIQGRMVRPVFLEGNGFVTRGGMCELDFSVHAALADDKVMLSSYDCSVEEAEVDTPCCLLTPHISFFITLLLLGFRHFTHKRVSNSLFSWLLSF